MADRALLPLLLIGGAVAAVAFSGAAKADDTTPQPDDGGAPPVPGHPVTQDGTVVLRGFKSNPAGIKIAFQIEQMPEGMDPKGDFLGFIFEPWAGNNPVTVSQGTTRQEARDGAIAFIDADSHGLPP